MNYYERFRPEAEKAVEANLADVIKLEQQISTGKKRLADEDNKIQRLGTHRGKLTAGAAESLASDDTETYEKFQTALRKNTTEAESRKDAIKQLGDTILPDLQKKLTEARSFFHGALERFAKVSVSIVRKEEINEHLAAISESFTACDSINRDFLAAFARIYAGFGIELNTDNLFFHPKPHPWPADEIDTLRITLNMGGLSTRAMRAIETQKRKDEIEKHNKEQLAAVKPQAEAPVTFPTVGTGAVRGRQE